MRTPSTTPQPALWRPSDYLLAVGVLCWIVLLISTPLLLLADAIWSLHLMRLWSRANGALFGLALIGAGIWIPGITHWSRGFMFGIAALFLGSVLDALDGTHDIMPMIVPLLTSGGALFAIEARDFLQQPRQRSLAWWAGVTVGVLAAGVYLSAAGYYFVLALMGGSFDVDRHPLYAVGIVIIGFLRHLRPRAAPPAG